LIRRPIGTNRKIKIAGGHAIDGHVNGNVAKINRDVRTIALEVAYGGR
jgi:hypothetical protein